MKRLLAGRGTTIAVMGMLLALVAGGSYALAASGSKTITVCVKKNGGALYKAKKCKKHDSKLKWNQQGPAGKAGKNGANGFNGAPGAAGTPGASGKDGFVQIGSWEDTVEDTTVDDTAFQFLGPTTTVTTNASQSIAASGSAAIGIQTGGPDGIDMGICRQPAGGGTVVPLASNSGTFEEVELTTTRLPYAISEAGAPGAGSFNIGMCAEATGATPVDINNNDWSIGYAFVTNSTLSVTGPPAVKAKGKAAH
jgi:hypothetical protein